MTLEEAIQSIKESLKSAPNEYEKSVQDGLQLLVWLESYKAISEAYPGIQKKIDRLEEENMRLLGSALRLGKRCEVLEAENNESNRLLRLAVEDFETAMLEEKCKVCVLEHCDYDEICKWRHHDEAMKLLGGNENDND